MAKLAWKLFPSSSLAKTTKITKITQIKKRRAFTLFEVMIALAILAIAMMASMVTTHSVLEKGIRLEEKIFAHWAAMNLINQSQLKMLKDKLEVSKTSGTISMRDKNYDWAMDISNLKIDDIEVLNINVEIIKNDGNSTSIVDTVTRNVTLL